VLFGGRVVGPAEILLAGSAPDTNPMLGIMTGEPLPGGSVVGVAPMLANVMSGAGPGLVKKLWETAPILGCIMVAIVFGGKVCGTSPMLGNRV